MPIDPKRVEAAARAYLASPSTLDDRAMVTGILNAAWPELASDPPTAWVAPRHMTDAMVAAIEGKVSHMDRSTDELVNFDFAQADRFWRAARDAHTKEQGGT